MSFLLGMTVVILLGVAFLYGFYANTDIDKLEDTILKKTTIKRLNLYFKCTTFISWVIFIFAIIAILYQMPRTFNIIDFMVVDGDSINIKTNIGDNFQRTQLNNIECPDFRPSTKNKSLAEKNRMSIDDIIKKGKKTKKFVHSLLKQHRSDAFVKYNFLYAEDAWGRRFADIYIGEKNLTDILVETGQCNKKESSQYWFVNDNGISKNLIITFLLSLISLIVISSVIYFVKENKQYEWMTNVFYILLFIAYSCFLFIGTYCLNTIIAFFPFERFFRVFYLIVVSYSSSYIFNWILKTLKIEYGQDIVVFNMMIPFILVIAFCFHISHCDEHQYAKYHEDECIYYDEPPSSLENF